MASGPDTPKWVNRSSPSWEYSRCPWGLKAVRVIISVTRASRPAMVSASFVSMPKMQKAARAAAGISEECNTWAGWKSLGYEVVHGSKALFQAVLIYGSKGDGATYTASFFSRSQVAALEA